MRTLILFVFIAFLGSTSQAQERATESKINTITLPVAKTVHQPARSLQESATAALFFKVKYGRVKRALLFKSKSKKTVMV